MDKKVKELKLGLPKGSLQSATIELFKKSGWKISGMERSYFPSIDDRNLRCSVVRAQEMSRYVESGSLDAGITGKDWIEENASDVRLVAELVYAKTSFRPVRWVLAVPQDSPIKKIEDLRGKKIATEIVHFTKRYFSRRKIPVEVEFSWGATEAKPPALADAVVEVTETGASLRANGLREVTTVLESTPRFIASEAAWADPWKRRKIEDIVLMLQGALAAEGKVGLMMNMHRADLDAVLAILPALKRPTISSLSDAEWVAVNTIVDESVVHQIMPKLKEAGAQGIVEYPLNKIIE